jgi:uncharacterized protein (DUF486 family)
MRAILLLVVSNVFMTFAWYGHLKWFPESKEHTALWKIVLLSWGIAFFEYCFQVPGNRAGAEDGMSAGQLKILQEIITLTVFVVFAWLFLKEKLTWNYFVAFGLMAAAAAFVFVVKPAPAPAAAPADVGTPAVVAPDDGAGTSTGPGASARAESSTECEAGE